MNDSYWWWEENRGYKFCDNRNGCGYVRMFDSVLESLKIIPNCECFFMQGEFECSDNVCAVLRGLPPPSR